MILKFMTDLQHISLTVLTSDKVLAKCIFTHLRKDLEANGFPEFVLLWRGATRMLERTKDLATLRTLPGWQVFSRIEFLVVRFMFSCVLPTGTSGPIGGTTTASYQGAPVNDLAMCILETRRRNFPHLSDFFLFLSFRLFEGQDDLTFQYLKIK